MHVFENPYIIIASLAIGVVVLAAISICFAVRGLRAANGQTERSFTSISKMESRFKAMGNRIVDWFYI